MKRFLLILSILLLSATCLPSCRKVDIQEEETTVSVISVKLDQTSLNLKEGESRTLTATVFPFHATHKEVSWSSSAPDVATVDGKGLVTAVKAGSATVTARAGNKSAECQVLVLSKEDVPLDVFPVNVVKALQQRSSLVKTLEDSVSYRLHDNVTATEIRYIDHAGNKQAAFIMQVNLSDPRVSITNTTPGDATFDAGVVKRERLSEQFKRIDKAGNRVLGGVNTDFFTTTGTYSGRPSGAFWHHGTCYRSVFASEANRPRCFVWWGEDEHVSMGRSIQYSSVTSANKVLELFSGGQYLVEGGKPATITEDSVSGVHPRTMFGTALNDRNIILVVIDGRQNSWSVGVDYPDMQAFMLAVGCHNAINIDGGGSSTFIVRKDGTSFTDASRFRICNKPSDGSERAIGPGLAVITTD